MIHRDKLRARLADEEARFISTHPKCRALHERAKRSLLGGVPMNWMVRVPGAFPIFVERASGSRFTDADGLDFLDLCLGDTGAMTGHAPPETVAAVA